MSIAEQLNAVQPKIRDFLRTLGKGVSGDLEFACLPATVSTPATASAWTRDVEIVLRNADGKVCEWFNATFTSGVSIADTSTAGTATIPSTTLTFKDGRAKVTISGDAASWAAAETDTLTVAQQTIAGYTVAQATSVETFT